MILQDPQAFLDWGAKGDHGYDNELPSMKPIFYATGPDFRKGAHSTAIRSVDVYPLLCELLGIEPQPNNGSLEATSDFLRKVQVGSGSSSLSSHQRWCSVIVAVVLAFLPLVRPSLK